MLLVKAFLLEKIRLPTIAVKGATSTRPNEPTSVFTNSDATCGLFMKSIGSTPFATKVIIKVKYPPV